MIMMNQSSSKISSGDLRASMKVIEVKPGKKFSLATLKALLPDVETALFFAKVYGLDAYQLAALLLEVFKTDLASALFGEGHEHSNELQDYLVEGWEDEDGYWHEPVMSVVGEGTVVFAPEVPHGEILPQVWDDLAVEVAASIKEVAEKLESMVEKLPGKQGNMVFSSMMKINAKRPTLGDYRAQIQHAPQKQNLLILDVSGSMSEGTVRRIIDDVVALSYQANACMAVVSNTTTFWEAGAYDVDTVLEFAEYGGTHYETLGPLLDRDWGVVITVADYDSSPSAKKECAQRHGHIDQVLDVSLVNQPTFLAQCVGQLASEVRPVLIGSGQYVMAY